MRLGLDRNDTVIRRRLRQKMELIAADDAADLLAMAPFGHPPPGPGRS